MLKRCEAHLNFYEYRKCSDCGDDCGYHDEGQDKKPCWGKVRGNPLSYEPCEATFHKCEGHRNMAYGEGKYVKKPKG